MQKVFKCKKFCQSIPKNNKTAFPKLKHMKFLLSLFHGCILCFFASAQHQYPVTKTVDSSDIYWGVAVKDPYRWLENLKDSSVLDWFKAQGEYTNAQLAKIPGQEMLIKEFKELNKITPA